MYFLVKLSLIYIFDPPFIVENNSVFIQFINIMNMGAKRYMLYLYGYTSQFYF